METWLAIVVHVSLSVCLCAMVSFCLCTCMYRHMYTLLCTEAHECPALLLSTLLPQDRASHWTQSSCFNHCLVSKTLSGIPVSASQHWGYGHTWLHMTFTWWVGFEPRSSCLNSECYYLLSHISTPWLISLIIAKSLSLKSPELCVCHQSI